MALSEVELAQKKQQAWMRVRRFAQEALTALVQADEAPMDQATLAALVEKAMVQIKLWEPPK